MTVETHGQLSNHQPFSLIVSVGLLGGFLLLMTVAIGERITRDLNTPSDPYEAIHSLESHEVGWYLDEYKEEVERDSMVVLLRRVFTESMRLRTFDMCVRLCIEEGPIELRPLIIKRWEYFWAMPWDTTWYTYNGEYYEAYGSGPSSSLFGVKSTLIQAGWYSQDEVDKTYFLR